MTRRIIATLILLSPLLFVPTSIAAVTSNPTINLDATLPSSLPVTSPTRWNDLATGTLQFVIGANSTYSTFGGGSLSPIQVSELVGPISRPLSLQGLQAIQVETFL